MMRSLVLVLVLGSGCQKASSGSGAEIVDAEPAGDVAGIVREAAAKLAPRHRQLVVYVGAAWCEPCKAIHDAIVAHQLDAEFPDLTLLAFDLDRDGDRLAKAGYVSPLIPLFALPAPDGTAGLRRDYGGVKVGDNVKLLSGKLQHLLHDKLRVDDFEWLAGTWRNGTRDTRWVRAGDVLWGVSLDDHGSYEVDLIRVADDRATLIRIDNGQTSSRLDGLGVTGTGADFEAGGAHVHLERTTPGTIAPAPAVELSDKAFAQRSLQGGGDAWPPWFAADGAMWDDGKRIEHDQIGETMRGVLDKVTIRWAPVASGAKGDLGFTVGRADYEHKPAGDHTTGSYCSIWRKQADGEWRIILDVGGRTER